MTGTAMAQVQKRRLSWMALTLVFTSVGLLFSLTMALSRFGSLGSALAYLEGQRLIADRRSVSFGEVEQGHRPVVTFELMNTSERNISILGAKTLCTCVLVENVPLSLPPKSRRAIQVAVKTDSRTGPIDETIYLFTDFPKQPKLGLSVRGQILGSRESPRKAASKEVRDGQPRGEELP